MSCFVTGGKGSHNVPTGQVTPCPQCVEVSKNTSNGATMVDRGVGGETRQFLDGEGEVGPGTKHDVHQRANSTLV